jgi:hypothetical protein
MSIRPSVCPSVCQSVRDFTFSSTRKCTLCHSLQWVLSYIFLYSLALCSLHGLSSSSFRCKPLLVSVLFSLAFYSCCFIPSVSIFYSLLFLFQSPVDYGSLTVTVIAPLSWAPPNFGGNLPPRSSDKNNDTQK